MGASVTLNAKYKKTAEKEKYEMTACASFKKKFKIIDQLRDGTNDTIGDYSEELLKTIFEKIKGTNSEALTEEEKETKDKMSAKCIELRV